MSATLRTAAARVCAVLHVCSEVQRQTVPRHTVNGAVTHRRLVASRAEPRAAKEFAMLYTIAVLLLILWLLGVVGTFAMGAFVHLLLVVALVLFVLGLFQGRRSAG